MNESLAAALEQAHQAYRSCYTGKGAWPRLKRFFRYPAKYICRALAQRFRWWSTAPVAANTCWGKELFVLLPDKNAGSLYYFGFLAKQEYPLSLHLAQTLKKEDVFYDVGANYGFYSVLAKTIVKEGEVHAFEPHPLLGKCLLKSFPTGVYINQVALSKEGGRATLYDKYKARHSGGSTIQEEVARRSTGAYGEYNVPVTSLDAYTSQHTAPTVMKIDVEGAEQLVLEGGRKTLETYHPRIAMEIWGGSRWDKYSRPAVELLFELGYKANELGLAGELISVSPTLLEERSMSLKYRNVVFLY